MSIYLRLEILLTVQSFESSGRSLIQSSFLVFHILSIAGILNFASNILAKTTKKSFSRTMSLKASFNFGGTSTVPRGAAIGLSCFFAEMINQN